MLMAAMAGPRLDSTRAKSDYLKGFAGCFKIKNQIQQDNKLHFAVDDPCIIEEYLREASNIKFPDNPNVNVLDFI